MKTLTDTDYIHTLIAEGEHQQQDFKFEISDARKIAKTLSAFANTDGGRLLIGVKDNGRIAGVRSEEEKYMIEAAAQLYCIPEIDYTLQTYIVEGKQVLVATIEENPHKPVYAKDENGKPACMATKWQPAGRTDPLYGTRTTPARPAGTGNAAFTQPVLSADRYFPTCRRTSACQICSV